MRRLLLVFASLAGISAAADIGAEMQHLTLDQAQSFHVRDVRLRRGDVSIYLTEGTLTFAHPVHGHTIAAVFTTEGAEAGDGEVILMPADAAERASLASFTTSPNLDEHFDTALLYFSDDTAAELRSQLHRESPPPNLTNAALALNVRMSDLVVPLLRAMLDGGHPFFGTFAGRKLREFDVLYDPDGPDPIVIGAPKDGTFRIWTSFQPRNWKPPANNLLANGYQIAGSIGEDLDLKAQATFQYQRHTASRTVTLALSPRLQVQSATIDGDAVAVFQKPRVEAEIPPNAFDLDSDLLLVSPKPIGPDTPHIIQLTYWGRVIGKKGQSFFVGDRTSWYPKTAGLLTNFDIQLSCPSRYRIVASGTLISEENHTFHYRTEAPLQLAGFNFGQYTESSANSQRYSLHVFGDAAAHGGRNDLPENAAKILDAYTRQWGRLPIHTVSITPIPGYFGQGFPGLIFLSDMTYMNERDRPPFLQSEMGNIFFNQLLLPHEIAHQWWGNLITAADYRSGWLMEAMANYAALRYIGQTDRVLAFYREALAEDDSAGPVDFGFRLLQNSGERAWHSVIYGKGTWILHMLHQRLGDAGFAELERIALHDYSGRGITNDEFRQLAAKQLKTTGPRDPQLKRFFETWIYGTGIPKLSLKTAHSQFVLNVSGVDESYSADVPVTCGSGLKWITAVAGDNPVSAPPGQKCALPPQSEFLYLK